MFYYIFYEWLFDPDKFTSIFRLFKYITFRSIYAALTALALSFILGPIIIKKLKSLNITQVIREEYLQNHIHKSSIPTMGGFIILIALIISTLLWARLDNQLIITVLLVTFFLGLLGLYDDYLKVVKNKPEGLIARNKLIGQTIIALGVALYFYYNPINSELGTSLPIPFFNKPPLDLKWLYIPFVVLVIVGSSNAVNLTDGLDGLAIGAVVFAAIAYAGLSYVGGNVKFAEYLRIIYVKGGGELTVFLAALIGAGLGFLWFNAYPAEIFMGDIGSLALGGALGTVAVLIKNELILLIIGGLFVMEASSVLIQVASYKLRGKRVFLMAPLHHHFERKGWKESKIIIRFWIIAIVFVLLSLSTLKLR